jgi:hypothetical protein
MFDSLPSVKYFDISPRIWHEYEIDEVELHEYFCRILDLLRSETTNV